MISLIGFENTDVDKIIDALQHALPDERFAHYTSKTTKLLITGENAEIKVGTVDSKVPEMTLDEYLDELDDQQRSEYDRHMTEWKGKQSEMSSTGIMVELKLKDGVLVFPFSILDKFRHVCELCDALNGTRAQEENIKLDLSQMIDTTSFGYILNYLNTARLTPPYIQLNMNDIVKTGAYLGLPQSFIKSLDFSVDHLYVRNLHPSDRDLRRQETEIRNKVFGDENGHFSDLDAKLTLEAVKKSHSLDFWQSGGHSFYEKWHFPTKYMDCQDEFIKSPIEHQSKLSVEQQLEAWKILPIFKKYPKNLVVAGGFITGLQLHRYGDVDLFLVTKDPKLARTIVVELIDALKTAQKRKEPLVRGEHTIAIPGMQQYTFSEAKSLITEMWTTTKIEIVLRLYNSIAQVISGFDISLSAVAYCDGQIYCMPRYLKSIHTQIILADPDRQSQNYGFRLRKYTRKFHSVRVAFVGCNLNKAAVDVYLPLLSVNEEPRRGLALVLSQFFCKNAPMNMLEYSNNANNTTKMLIRMVWQTLRLYDKERPLILDYDYYSEIEDCVSELKTYTPMVWSQNKKLVKRLNAVFEIFRKKDAIIPYKFYANSDFVESKRVAHVSLFGQADEQFTEYFQWKTPFDQNARVEFRTKNPGTQTTNSFYPRQDKWFCDLYCSTAQIGN